MHPAKCGIFRGPLCVFHGKERNNNKHGRMTMHRHPEIVSERPSGVCAFVVPATCLYGAGSPGQVVPDIAGIHAITADRALRKTVDSVARLQQQAKRNAMARIRPSLSSLAIQVRSAISQP